mmetsp:Transcript_11246/g.41185  ORF Transcript_11246/g.41185 Transcript_11246/m.41185 type:complete len:101 (-) Transcript_11246:3250-3552(-)|eukprot:scaffold4066_cov417-Prasinococcus_capsulatus_cf.AAC.5
MSRVVDPRGQGGGKFVVVAMVGLLGVMLVPVAVMPLLGHSPSPRYVREVQRKTPEGDRIEMQDQLKGSDGRDDTQSVPRAVAGSMWAAVSSFARGRRDSS